MIDPSRAAFALPGDIATLTGGYVYDRRLVEGLRAAGRAVEVIALPGSLPQPPRRDMARAVAQLQAVPAEMPLIVDGLAFGALDPAGVAGIRAPLVAMIHHPLAQESALPADLARHLWRTERANLAHARHVLVPSPHTREMLIARYDVPPGRITVARPGTDRPLRQPGAAAPAGPQEGPPLILSVGLLHPRKGHDVLIAALALIADLDWRAVIAGNPWDAAHVDALRAQIAGAALGARLTLAGRVDDDRLARLYRQAAIFALATRYEGYGIVFDEALSHGLPIVSTRAGAVPGTVPPEAGLLVPPDDAPAFAQALARLLCDPEARAARARAAARAGAALPGWSDTAAVAARVLDALA